MSYKGAYINLDRRTDRRAEIENELARHGLSDIYSRFSAADGNALNLPAPRITPGEMGGFTSHYLLLKQNLGSEQHLHIVEDDVIFSQATAPVINSIIDQNLLAECDIIYTDVFIPVRAEAYKAYKKFYDTAVTRDAMGRATVKNYSVVALKGRPFGSTSSYVVNKNSIQKIHDFYARQITSEPGVSNDLFIRALSDAGLLKVGCIFPFVTSIRIDHIVADTDIEHTYSKKSGLAAHLARYSFFVDADLDKCEAYLDKFLPLPENPGQHAGILNHLLVFSLTDDYQDF